MFLLGTLLNVNGQVPSYVPKDSLKAWWPFTANANDLSGNNKNGTVQNATLTTDRYGKVNSAYYFNGTNSYIQVPDNNDSKLDLTKNFTISIWASAEQLVGNGPTMLSKHIGNIDNMGSYELIAGYQTSLKKYKLTFFATPHYDNTAYSNFSSFTSNTWENYTCTYDYINQNCIYYFNGNAVDTVNINYDINNTTIDFLIGCTFINNTFSYDYFWKGKLDDIGVWNRVLTTSEIKGLYNSCNSLVTNEPISQTVNINQQARFVISSNDNLATYQWQSDLGTGFQNISNAGQYFGAQNDTLLVNNPTMSNNNQNFRCIVKSGSCLDTSNHAVLKVFDNVGLNNSSIENVKIYPNPTSTQLVIENGNFNIMGPYSVKIVNTAGQQVFQSTLNQQQFSIDTKTIGGSGIYSLYITDTNNNIVSVKKIILQ